MPMPHRTQMKVIKRRLTGKEGTERVRELRAILQELPGYRNGPFADIRKWVLSQIEETHTRSHVVQRDSIAVRREGVAQVALRLAQVVGLAVALAGELQLAVAARAHWTLAAFHVPADRACARAQVGDPARRARRHNELLRVVGREAELVLELSGVGAAAAGDFDLDPHQPLAGLEIQFHRSRRQRGERGRGGRRQDAPRHLSKRAGLCMRTTASAVTGMR